MESARVLIVEDEIIVASDLEIRLNSMGYETVGIAASGTEALQLADEARPDLVLMDIVLRGDLDGIETAAEIRKLYRPAMIYLTAYADMRTLERAKLTEPFAYLVKPFSEWELRANIEMALYRNRMEARMRNMEGWFVATVQGVTDGVIAANGENRITRVNSVAELITGWKQEEVLGRRLGEILRLKRREDDSVVGFEGVEEGPVVCLARDTLLLDRENQVIPIDNTTSAIRDEDERPCGTISVFRDASGLRHGSLVRMGSDVNFAIGETTTPEGMLQIVTEAIVRNMDVAFARVWTLDASGKMLLLRASAGMYTHLNGFHSRVPIGKHKIGRIAKDRTPHVTNDVVNDPWISDPEWARREHFVSFAGYPLVVGGDLVGVLAVFGREHLSDTAIEALGSAARSVAVGIQRRKLEEQYRQSQKMEAIGQLAGGVAHDFNNLLSVILGYTQILLGREDLPESVPPRLEQIKRAGERAAALTRQLLAFGRRQIMEPRVLDLNAVLRDLDPMLHRLISENIKLEIRTDPDLARTKADPSQLEQVIVNLAVNARDAMPEGGELVISTSNAEVDRERAAIQTEPKEGAYVRLVVSDSGMGMTPDVRQRIFEPFFTTKERGKGTGLGLATVYGIVQQSGGYISVYSEPGIGTTFRVDLPATREKKAVRRPARGGASRRAPEGTETVLLVEDEAAVRSVARDALADLGYTVLEAGDGVEALQTSEAYPDPIHLVVTDVIMPRMNGSRLVEEITKQRPGIRHLFVSGYADDEVFRHRILPSGTPFLAKPFTPGSLGSKVRSVLDSPAREETEPQAE